MTDAPATLTFRALSALLAYPTAELCAATGEIEAAIAAEGLLDAQYRRGLQALLAELAGDDLYAPQEAYVELFDRTRRLSLNLFEHVHGESRDRGQAMVDLAALYERGGLTLAVNELPDYLPLFLEFLSTRPLDEARALLADTGHILTTLEERLAKRASPYAAVFAALRTLAGETAGVADGASDEDDDSPAALDAAWEETQVTFGPGDAMDGCPAGRIETRLRAAQRDARPATA